VKGSSPARPPGYRLVSILRWTPVALPQVPDSVACPIRLHRIPEVRASAADPPRRPDGGTADELELEGLDYTASPGVDPPPRPAVTR